MNFANVILCGLWVGPRKPIIHCLLDPVVKTICKLSTVGVNMNSAIGHLTFRAKIAMGVFDLPAKVRVLNAKQYNGNCGCSASWKETFQPFKGLSTWAYIPHAQVVAAGLEAEQTKSCIQGIPWSVSICIYIWYGGIHSGWLHACYIERSYPLVVEQVVWFQIPHSTLLL